MKISNFREESDRARKGGDQIWLMRNLKSSTPLPPLDNDFWRFLKSHLNNQQALGHMTILEGYNCLSVFYPWEAGLFMPDLGGGGGFRSKAQGGESFFGF